MTQKETVKLAIVVNDVAHIKDSVARIERALLNHVKHDEQAINRFATKSLEDDFKLNESNVKALSKEIGDLPHKLRTSFANIWTEQFLKGVLVMIIGTAVVSTFLHFLK